MRRRDPSDDLVEVEIVEVAGHDDLTGAPLERTDEAPDEAALHPTRRRLLRWLGIGVIAGLALTVAVVNVAEARRDAARREAFADLPWVMPPMDGPLEEVWRTPGGWLIAETDDLIVVSGTMATGQVRAIDARTGGVRWERAGAGDEYCDPIQDWTTRGEVIGPVLPHPEMLMCIPFDASGADGTPPAEGASIPITFVDLDTGEALGRVIVDGQLINHTVVGADMLLVSVRAEGAVGAVRVNPRSGTVVWTWTSGPGVLPDGAFGDWTWDLDEDSGVLRIGGAREVAVSVQTGAEVDPGPIVRDGDGDVTARLELVSGQLIEMSYDEGLGRESTRVLETDGTTRFEVDGSPWWNQFDDGSVSDALVIQWADIASGTPEVTLTSVDLATGEERWSLMDGYTYPVFLLDGIALGTTGSSTSALDLRTGRWLWEGAGMPGVMFVSPLTDGEVVLVPVSDGPVSDGPTALAALDLRTGEEQWRMPMPRAVADARVVLGTLIITTDSEVVAYR